MEWGGETYTMSAMWRVLVSLRIAIFTLSLQVRWHAKVTIGFPKLLIL
jgi:hypothetical protein